jgi:hypothetical protein
VRRAEARFRLLFHPSSESAAKRLDHPLGPQGGDPAVLVVLVAGHDRFAHAEPASQATLADASGETQSNGN